MLLREVRELRKRFDVYSASLRAPNHPHVRLTDQERDEASRTYYVKPHGASGALEAHLAMLSSNPARGFYYFGYFPQALMLGPWMRRNQIPHLHVHYSSTVGLLIKKAFPITLSISFHGPDNRPILRIGRKSPWSTWASIPQPLSSVRSASTRGRSS